MLNNRKLILDTFCEVYDLLHEYADGEFWDFASESIKPNTVYLIGRAQFFKNINLIKQLANRTDIQLIFSNPAEGSETLAGQCNVVRELVQNKQILLIGGGDMDNRYSCLQYDSFLPKIHDYEENIQASSTSHNIFLKKIKPYKFLFLNGRYRTHRKYLIERFGYSGLLDQAIWSNLETRVGRSRSIKFIIDQQDFMNNPGMIKYLDSKYEVDRYRDRLGDTVENTFVKNNLFKQEWGEIYINPEPYIDTYFSLVTETVFDYPYSFRTEKIWKPICMGHPWIAAANRGYYRDMHNLGFKTFGHLIDETFDQIDNSQDRIERISQVVEDLCQQDLAQFLATSEETCKHNQQHYAEMRIKVRKEFPTKFFEFVNGCL
jgi:hypothetical protein